MKRPGPLFNKRQTFVIGTDRKVIDVIRSETNMETHADQALADASPNAERMPRRTGAGYQPTLPSTISRMRSACPLWRAYSSIMCT